jgi:K+-sensing histidine kinase KdpD
VNEYTSDSPEQYIQQVLQPFEYEIKAKNMVVDLNRAPHFSESIKIDWRLYELIIFNIIQNGIKYNKRGGHISITIAFNKSGIFETIICDEGTGIEKDRIPNLFKIFGELRQKVKNFDFAKIKDNGIGVGLCCSKVIANALNGDVTLQPNM